MKKNIVPPAQAKPLHKQGTYKPSAQMQINLERSAKVYPHSLKTPTGTGNYREFGNLGRRP